MNAPELPERTRFPRKLVRSPTYERINTRTNSFAFRSFGSAIKVAGDMPEPVAE